MLDLVESRVQVRAKRADRAHGHVDPDQRVGQEGIDLADSVFYSDSYNDLPLLEVCGLRIVMGDAPDELKAIADYVAPSIDEDGLAVAIEEFVLPLL